MSSITVYTALMNGTIAQQDIMPKKATDSAKELAALVKKMKKQPQPSGYPGGEDRDQCSVCRTLGHDCPRHRTVPDLSKKAKAPRVKKAKPTDDPEYAAKLAKAKAVMQAFDHVRTWVSDPDDSSTGKTYTTMIQGDGRISCNCQGWCMNKRGAPHRDCKHQKRAVRDLTLEGKKMEVRSVGADNYLYVI